MECSQYTQSDYEQLIARLKSMSDEKYRIFNESLLPDNRGETLGVRVPLLRNEAKKISSGSWRSFLDFTIQNNCYEIIMIDGIITVTAKCPFEETLDRLSRFIPRINNWAVNDTVSNSFKSSRTHPEETMSFLHPLFSSEKEFEVRFGATVLLSHFINDDYIKKVLEIYDSIRHPGYYAQMAVAWGVSICYINYPKLTQDFLLHCSLDDFTYNKALQKTIESYRISPEVKDSLRLMKRK